MAQASTTEKQPPRPFALYLDFDGTMTVDDTMAALAAYVGYENNASKPLPKWSDFTRIYAAEKAALDARLVEDDDSYEDGLREVEEASAARVLSSGLFDNVTEHHMSHGAAVAVRSGSVRFRDGLWTLLRTAWRLITQAGEQGRGVGLVGVISANWSRRWILGCVTFEGGAEIAHGLDGTIEANELPGVGNGMPKAIRLRRDKALTLQAEMEKRRQSPAEKIVYVGDSATDIDCLRHAHFGICIRDEPMRSAQQELADRLKARNVSVVWVGDAHKAVPYLPDRMCLWARDFNEIDEWLRAAFEHDWWEKGRDGSDP